MTLIITGKDLKRLTGKGRRQAMVGRRGGRSQAMAAIFASMAARGPSAAETFSVMEEDPPDPTPEAASAAPTTITEVATRLNGTASTNRYSISTIYPAGDWTLATWARTEVRGCMFNSGPTSSPYTSNNTLAIFCDPDAIAVVGKDSAGVVLGVSSACGGNNSSRGLASRFALPPSKPFFVCVVKVGSLIQLWLKFPGHAAQKVSEETTTFGATTAQGGYFGCDRSGSFKWVGSIRRPFMVSYSLTEAQINAVAEGASPLDYGTPAASDWYFPVQTAGTAWTNTVPGATTATATAFLTGYTTVTGIGNAALADGVYIKPDQDGRVFQRSPNGRATITLSGIYRGSAAPIQVLPLDWATGDSVGVWTTIDAAPANGVWTGTITLRSRAGWFKFQTRKVIAGVPSTHVVTSDVRVGVGEIVMLHGQSTMENMSNDQSGTDVTANGLWSWSRSLGALVNGVGQEWVAITGAVNDGNGAVRLTTQYPHGRRTGQRIYVVAVTGTVEANGHWTATVTARDQVVLQGSTFSNTYVSGGLLYFVQPRIQVAENAIQTVYGGMAVIGNYLSSQLQCPVELINRSIGAQAIESFSSYTYANGVGGRGILAVLHAKHAEKIGAVLWLHGHANVGDMRYFSDAGVAGAWTGWGLLGTLYTFLSTEFPDDDFAFGVGSLLSAGGIISALSPSTIHEFRHGMHDWTQRKNEAGDFRVFSMGYFNDLQPKWENAVPFNSHLNPPNNKRYAARMAQSLAYHLGKVSVDAIGPRIDGAARSGNVITVYVRHNGGSAIHVLRDGARPSGFEVSADNFSTTLAISNIEIVSPTTIRITLQDDPGGPVRVRYQWGYVGNYPAGTYFTPRITNASAAPSGAIRITTATTGLTPTGSQPPGGHGLTTGQWVLIQEVAGTTEANGIWEVSVVDSTNFDLVGSTFVNAFVAGGLYGATTTGTVVKELGVPIYDNRTIGGYDTNGAALAPTYTSVLAA